MLFVRGLALSSCCEWRSSCSITRATRAARWGNVLHLAHYLARWTKLLFIFNMRVKMPLNIALLVESKHFRNLLAWTQSLKKSQSLLYFSDWWVVKNFLLDAWTLELSGRSERDYSRSRSPPISNHLLLLILFTLVLLSEGDVYGLQPVELEKTELIYFACHNTQNQSSQFNQWSPALLEITWLN